MSGYPGFTMSGSQAIAADDDSKWNRGEIFVLTGVNLNSAATASFLLRITVL